MARTVDIATLSDRMYPSRGGWAVRAMINDKRETFWAQTKTDLKDKVKAAIARGADYRRGVIDDNPPRNYDEACNRRLAVYRHRESSKTTFEANLVRSRIKFGPLRLDQITRHGIEVWATDMSEEGLAGVTISNYLDDMERVLEYARDNGWLVGPNPAKNVDRPACIFKPNPFESWDTVFEIARAFDTIDFPVGGRITRFAAGLGLRPQEVLVSRECDLDRTLGTHTIQRSWDDTLRIEVPLNKTSASQTTLSLTTMAADVVDGIPQAIHRDPDNWQNSPLLFARPDGSRITPDYFRNKWAEALGTIPHVAYKPPKSLRDTFATLTLLDRGLDQIDTVAVLMRHTSSKVTRKHYAEIVQKLMLKAAGDASRGMPRFEALS